MWNLKNNPNELIYKTDTGNKFKVLPKGKGREREKPGQGINRSTLPYIKQINNKVLLYSAGNYIQYLVVNFSGKYLENNIDIHIYLYN